MASPPLESDPITGQKPSEDCAVVGVVGTEDALPKIILGLRSLQHRGQESAGIAVFNENVIKVKKGMGLVSEVFNEKDPHLRDSLPGNAGIGHTRYSTKGSKSLDNAGPFVLSSTTGYLAVSHNGEITNAERLREVIKKKGAMFITNSDTETMLMEFSRDIAEMGVYPGIRLAMSRLKGAYSIALMVNDTLYAIRDPFGFRPLTIGRVNGSYVVSSESCVYDVLGGEMIRDVKPGEVIELTPNGYNTVMQIPSKTVSHCMFEYVYFARPDSVIDGIEVFETRINLGRSLAREHPVTADVVIPVPDSGRAQAVGFANESGIPYNEGLIKNRFSERTFIMPNQTERINAIKLKLNPIKSAIKGKRVVLVDDSIVRGNTLRHIISILRKQGATEVHVRVGSPQIVAACYFGVDMKTKDEFIARDKSVDEIRKEIGADSLGYISISGLVESIGMPENRLCLGCLTGEYPTYIPGEEKVKQTELENY